VHHRLALLLLLAACSADPVPPVQEPAPAEPVAEPSAEAPPHPPPDGASPPPPGPGGFGEDAGEVLALLEQARGAASPAELYAQARAACEALAAEHPELPELLLLRANVAMQELAMTNPDPARASELRAEARAQYERVLAAQPDSFQALQGLADAHMVAHTATDDARAAELFERALAIQPDDSMVRLRLGEAQHRLGRYEQAEASLKAAMAGYEAAGDGPGVVNAKNLLGRMYMDQGRMEEAEAILEESAAGLEELADKTSYYGCPYQALGALYHQTGREAESVEAMKRVAELEPHSIDSQLLAARACREAGDQECAAHYEARAEALRQR
jgi:tetratricopeptide (TPR) repeat protein